MALRTKLEYDDFDVQILYLMNKIKKLEKEVRELAMLKRVVVGGGSRLFSAIKGTIANAQTPNTLLLDGSRAMTGNIDMDNNEIVDFKQILPYDTLQGVLGNSSHILLQVASQKFIKWNLIEASGNAQLATGNDRYINFVSQLTAGDQEVARISGGYMDISRAGDITFSAATKKLTWDNTLRLVKEEDYRLRVEDGDSELSDIHVYTAFMDFIESLIPTSTLVTSATANGTWKFKSHTGAAYVDNIWIKGGRTYLFNLPGADPGVAGQLWNDGGTVKVSAG